MLHLESANAQTPPPPPPAPAKAPTWFGGLADCSCQLPPQSCGLNGLGRSGRWSSPAAAWLWPWPPPASSTRGGGVFRRTEGGLEAEVLKVLCGGSTAPPVVHFFFAGGTKTTTTKSTIFFFLGGEAGVGLKGNQPHYRWGPYCDTSTGWAGRWKRTASVSTGHGAPHGNRDVHCTQPRPKGKPGTMFGAV